MFHVKRYIKYETAMFHVKPYVKIWDENVSRETFNNKKVKICFT